MKKENQSKRTRPKRQRPLNVKIKSLILGVFISCFLTAFVGSFSFTFFILSLASLSASLFAYFYIRLLSFYTHHLIFLITWKICLTCLSNIHLIIPQIQFHSYKLQNYIMQQYTLYSGRSCSLNCYVQFIYVFLLLYTLQIYFINFQKKTILRF